MSGMVCVKETARVSERPSVRRTACVRSLYEREMTVGMREHAAASPSVYHGMVCKRRNTQVCVGGMATETATEGQRPSSGRSCFGNRAGSARQGAWGPCRASHKAATCTSAQVKPGP